MKNTLLPLLPLLLLLPCASLPAQTLVASNYSNTTPFVANTPAGIITVAFVRTQLGGVAPYGTTSEIVVVRSVDAGATWWLNTRPAPGMRWESDPVVVPDGNGGCMLFYKGSTNVGISNFSEDYRRETSPDCVTFGNRTTLAGFPFRLAGAMQVVRDQTGALTATYPDSNNLYLTRSIDGGASWEAERTLAAPGIVASLVYRASDQRYFLAHVTNLGLFVKPSGAGGPRDWSTTAIKVADAGVDHPKLSLLNDGSLMLVWGRGSGEGRQIWAATSADGTTWSLPFFMKSSSPGAIVQTPYVAAAGPAGAFDLYWASGFTDSSMRDNIYREVGQLPADAIFADTFEQQAGPDAGPAQ